MTKRICAWTALTLMVAVTMALLVPTATSQPQPGPKKTLFSTLKVGQSVILKDKGTAFEISTMDLDGAGTHKVVEVNDDFVVLKNLAEVSEMRIPVYAVKAVIHTKLK